MCNTLVAKTSCSLSQLGKHNVFPVHLKNTNSPPSESKRRGLNLKKQQAAYKNATADPSQVYDGHDMIPQYFSKCRRNSGIVRAELDKKFHSKSDKNRKEKVDPNTRPAKSTDAPSKLDVSNTERVRDMTAGFSSFNQDDHSASTSSTAASSATTTFTQGKAKQPPSNSTSSSSTHKMIRRKKSSPHHRVIELNRKLSGIIKSPRYSQGRPEDLSISMQDLGANGIAVDERLTKSMTDLNAQDWPESLDYNSVHFRRNVEVYCYKI